MPARFAFARRAVGDSRRGGVLVWRIGAALVCAALGVLAWMVVLPRAVESRLAAVTGARFQVTGLMGDPFGGRATATGWVLRATDAENAPVLARGGRAEIVVPDWRGAIGDGGAKPEKFEIERLDLNITDLDLSPDATGAWPVLALAAAAGMPYEHGGKIGPSPRLRVKRLKLRVAQVTVKDAATGRATPMRIDWQGEFRDLDHSRPVVTALLAAAGRGAAAK